MADGNFVMDVFGDGLVSQRKIRCETTQQSTCDGVAHKLEKRIRRKMPRFSIRAKFIIALRSLSRRRMRFRLMRMIAGERNPLMDCVDALIKRKLAELESKRYLERKKYRARAFNVFGIDNDSSNEDSTPHLSDDEFKQKYRMSRVSFELLLNLIKNHPVFGENSTRM